MILGKKYHTLIIPDEWRIRALSELCDRKPEYGSGDAAIPFDDTLPRYVRITDIDNNGNLKKNAVSAKLGNNENSILKNNDFLFARTGSVGKTFLYSKKHGKCIFAGYLIRFKLDDKKILPLFLHYYTHSKNYWKWVFSEATQGVQPNINAQQYTKLIIPIPPILEQEKILVIFSNIDNLITHHNSLIESTMKLKRGLIQYLFTKGIGHKKFKNVKWLFGKKIDIPKEWDVVTLEHVSKIIDSLHITPTYSSKGIPMIRSTEIKYGDLKLENASRVSTDVYKQFTTNHEPQRNDIVMSRVGTYFVTSFVNTDEQFCMGQNTLIINPKINPSFLYHFLNSIFVTKQIEFLFDRTSGQKTMSLKNIKNLHIFLPSLLEQEKIAFMLQSYHLKITELESKKTNLEIIKKGLMQKLLTGQIRVTL